MSIISKVFSKVFGGKKQPIPITTTVKKTVVTKKAKKHNPLATFRYQVGVNGPSSKTLFTHRINPDRPKHIATITGPSKYPETATKPKRKAVAASRKAALATEKKVRNSAGVAYVGSGAKIRSKKSGNLLDTFSHQTTRPVAKAAKSIMAGKTTKPRSKKRQEALKTVSYTT